MLNKFPVVRCKPLSACKPGPITSGAVELRSTKKHGRHHKKLAISSKNNIEFVNGKCRKFCIEAELGDPQVVLRLGDPVTFKTFFEMVFLPHMSAYTSPEQQSWL